MIFYCTTNKGIVYFDLWTLQGVLIPWHQIEMSNQRGDVPYTLDMGGD